VPPWNRAAAWVEDVRFSRKPLCKSSSALLLTSLLPFLLLLLLLLLLKSKPGPTPATPALAAAPEASRSNAGKVVGRPAAVEWSPADEGAGVAAPAWAQPSGLLERASSSVMG
jgi:hypothetical protein